MSTLRKWTAASIMLLWAATTMTAQDPTQFSHEDARLNEVYRQRLSQLSSEPSALAALRGQERDWIKQRDKQCIKDVPCLAQATKARADYIAQQVSENDSLKKADAPIPQQLWGKWVIGKVVPTRNVSCWDQRQADALVGTNLEYRADAFAWNGKTISNSGSKTSTLQAKDFESNNGGSGGAADFHQLGIQSNAVLQIEIQHPDASVYDKSAECCAEIPGETVMITGDRTFIFGVCGVYYGASRFKDGKS
jgi:uncharacterized protein